MTGLCAFVPREDMEKSPENNQMRVLLVDSSMGMDIGAMDVSHTHEPHVPVLLAPSVNIDPSAGFGKPDLTFVRSDDNSQWSVFYLDGQDLRIAGAADNKLKVTIDSTAGEGVPSQANLLAFEWVASFENISPGSGEVRLSE
jgi:hypothetical protein